MPRKAKRQAAAVASNSRPKRAKKEAKQKVQTPKQAAARIRKAFPQFANPPNDDNAQHDNGHFKAALRALVGLGDTDEERKLFDHFNCSMGPTAYSKDESWFEQIGGNSAHQQTLNHLLMFLFQTTLSGDDDQLEKTRQEFVTKTKKMYGSTEHFAETLYLLTCPRQARIKKLLCYLGKEW